MFLKFSKIISKLLEFVSRYANFSKKYARSWVYLSQIFLKMFSNFFDIL